MLSLYNIYKDLIVETVTRDSVMRALQNHKRVNITYKDGESKGLKRVIEVYAYGTTKAGHPVIRAYQVFGDSVSEKVPAWKFFRLDKIVTWEETNFTFHTPIHMRDPQAPKYREPLPGSDKGYDDTMDAVWAVTKFDYNKNKANTNNLEDGTESEQSESGFE